VRHQTMMEMMERMLRIKFGKEALQLMPRISYPRHPERLDSMFDAIVKATTLDRVRRACAAQVRMEEAAESSAPASTCTRRKRS
jgi:hypothetical protein